MPANEASLAAPSERYILVVDDDPNTRDLVEAIAAGEGFNVVTGVDGLDGAKKAGALSPDLLITDLMMPGLGGYELLRKLQKGSPTPMPVFVISGVALEPATVNLIRAEDNVLEFIPKPIHPETLVAALHKHLKTAPRAR